MVSGQSLFRRTKENPANDLTRLAVRGLSAGSVGSLFQWGQVDNTKISVQRVMKQLVITRVECGFSHFLGLLVNRRVIAWGDNSHL